MNTSAWQNRRVWLGGTAALAVLIVAAAWFLAISPKRSDAASTQSQTNNVQTQNGVLAASNAALARQKSHLAGYQARLLRALQALPGNSQLPEFTVSVTAAAKQTHVAIKSIDIGDQTAVVAPVAAAPTTDAASPSPTASSAAPNPTSTGAVPAVTSSAAASQYSIPITIQASGTPENETVFVRELEAAPRAATVTSAQFAASNKSTILTVQLNVFTAPMSPAQVKEFKHLLAAGS